MRCPVRPQLLAEGEGRNEAVAVHPAIRMCIHRVSRGIYRSSGLVIVWRSTMLNGRVLQLHIVGFCQGGGDYGRLAWVLRVGRAFWE